MAFTSWTDLHAALLNAYAAAIASGNIVTASYSVVTAGSTRQVQYRTLSDLRAAIDQAKFMADLETGSSSGRTYAANGGRG